MLNTLKTILLDWGLLLEVLGIILVAPLTASLVERDRRAKLRELRRNAALQLSSDFLLMCWKLQRGMIELATHDPDVDELLKTSHQALKTDPEIRGSKRLPSDLEDAVTIHVNAIQSSQRYYDLALANGQRELREVQFVCSRLHQDIAFYADVLEAVELARLGSVRSSLGKVEHWCHLWLNVITSLRVGEGIAGPPLLDLREITSHIIGFLEILESQAEREKWYYAFLTFCVGVKFVRRYP